jgi:hypothetical protein
MISISFMKSQFTVCHLTIFHTEHCVKQKFPTKYFVFHFDARGEEKMRKEPKEYNVKKNSIFRASRPFK